MTLNEIFEQCCKCLDKFSESAALDSRIIISFVCNLTDQDFALNKNKEIRNSECERILELVNQRKSGKPVAYITGYRAFFRDVFKTNPNVLIPQPDTETLVEQAVEYAKKTTKKKLSVLDLCAGTGCIGISFVNEVCHLFESIDLYLSDLSKYAFDCFSCNAELVKSDNVNVHLCLGSLFENFSNNKFDLILTNPPYIETSVIKTLPIEVQAEPLLALDGGEDGLGIIRQIVNQAPLFLNENSALFMEIGHNQKESVSTLFKSAGFENIETVKDLGGNWRVVKGIL